MKRSIKIILSIALIIAFIATSMGFTTIAVKGIKLNTTNLKLSVGKTYQLKIQFTPANTTQKSVIYSTANKSIAIVNSAGLIKGIKAGKTVITVTSKTNKKVLAKCNVTISPAVYANRCPYKGPTVTLNGFTSDSGVKEDKNSPVYKLYKEAVGNIEIKWEAVPGSDFFTKATLYLNSGEIPDIFTYGAGALSEGGYTDSGLFLNLNKYKDAMPNFNALAKKTPALLTYQSIKGELFTIPCPINDYFEEGFIANKTLLDSMGIAVPTTLKQMEDAMEKIKAKDPTITPFQSYGDAADYYFSMFSTVLGASRGIYFDLTDKKWKHAILETSSKYKELVALLAKYYAKGYLNPEFSTMSREQAFQILASNKWAFSFMYGGSPNQEVYKVQNSEPLPVKLVPFMPAADGVKPQVALNYISDNPSWGYSIGAKTKYPELVVSWIDTMLGEKVSDAFQWGVKGISYTIDSKGDKQWIPEFLAKGSDYTKEFGIWNIRGPRFVTNRDDTSFLRKAHPYEKSHVTFLVNGVESGKILALYPRNLPIFTTEQKDELSSTMTAANTLIEQNVFLFVLGKRPMSEWDSFVKEVLAAGNLKRAVEIYNSAKQSPDRQLSSQRKYIKP